MCSICYTAACKALVTISVLAADQPTQLQLLKQSQYKQCYQDHHMMCSLACKEIAYSHVTIQAKHFRHCKTGIAYHHHTHHRLDPADM